MASTSVNIPTQSDNNDLQSPSGSAVRSNGLFLLRSSWSNISRVNKLMLVSSVFFIVSQIAVSIIILILYKDDYCDKPLDTYLIVYSVRIFLLLPLLIYRYSRRPLTPEEISQQQQQRRQELQERRMQFQHNRTGSAISSTTTNNSQATSIHQVTPLTRNNINNSATKQWCDKFKSLLDLFGILWFIVGNYLIFTSYNCTFMAPAYYYTVLAWILFGYIIILIPVILCAAVIFCLPCVLVILQVLQINNVPGVTKGATQAEINKIPVYKYKEDNHQTNNGSTSHTDNRYQQQKKSWFRRLFLKFRKSNNDLENGSYPPITIHPMEDALCSICLGEYENDELICKLWCNHHFHKDCLHQWVGLNSLCPLCKQDFRGKQFNDNTYEEENTTELTESRG